MPSISEASAPKTRSANAPLPAGSRDAGPDNSAPVSIANIEQRARELARGEKWGRAARVLMQAARAEPGDAARWLQIAQWQRHNRQPQVAAQTLRAALRLNRQLPGRNAKTPLNVGVKAAAHDTKSPAKRAAKTEGGKSGTAEQKAKDKRIFSDKEQAALWQALAETYLEAQNWKAGIEACEALLSLTPQHHFAREILATALLHSGRVDDAARVMRELLALSPRDPLHRLKMATLLQLQGHSGESLREFERVAFTYPDAPFSAEANEAIEALDNVQMQQILMRAGEQDEFRHALEHEMDSVLHDNGFHLSDGGRESLRHMLGDGRPDFDAPPPRIH